MWIQVQPLTILEIAVVSFAIGSIAGFALRGVMRRKK